MGTGSPANLLSAGPWQTFASGLMPGEQGHYFPLQWDPSAMRFVPMKQDSLGFEPFWDALARGGVETIVFDAMAVPLKTMPRASRSSIGIRSAILPRAAIVPRF